jgi:hypothetical protein
MRHLEEQSCDPIGWRALTLSPLRPWSQARSKSPCWRASSSRAWPATAAPVIGLAVSAMLLGASATSVTFAGSALAAVAGLGVFASLMVEASGAAGAFVCGGAIEGAAVGLVLQLAIVALTWALVTFSRPAARSMISSRALAGVEGAASKARHRQGQIRKICGFGEFVEVPVK